VIGLVRVFAPVFGLVGLLTFATAAYAQNARDASTLLMRMNQAFAQETYDGVFIYYSGEEMASLRVVHKIVDGQQRERLVHLNGAPREILRHGDRVICIVMPGDDIAVLEDSIPAGPFARAFVRQFDQLSASYRVETMGEGRVASRRAVRVLVTPLDQYRYGYRLWLDEATALLLRSEMVDQEGRRLEVFQFSRIDVGEQVTDAALEPEQLTGSMVSHLTLKTEAEAQTPKNPTHPNWQLSWVPPGFNMAANDIRTKASEVAVNSMMYSDGLATFSLFVEKMPAGGAASMISQTGATVAITRGLRNDGKMYLVTLVGEIPVDTGQQIINGMEAQL
jgi:sigma-E factor negative regulatory protein RseB